MSDFMKKYKHIYKILMLSVALIVGFTWVSDATSIKRSQATIIINKARMSSKLVASVEKWKGKIIDLSLQHENQVYIKGNLPQSKKAIALTFDDGPDGNITPKIMDALDKKSVKATFFFQGNHVASKTKVVKRAFEEGHQIAVHSYSHPQLTKISEKSVKSEMNKTAKAVKKIIGYEPLYFRPPYGDMDEKTLKYIDRDYQVVIWSVDTMDWVKGTTGKEIANFIISNAKPNDIILMHSSEGKKATLEAVPLIIEGLGKKGYTFYTLEQMIGKKAYR